jgi:hypothetical protein
MYQSLVPASVPYFVLILGGFLPDPAVPPESTADANDS